MNVLVRVDFNVPFDARLRVTDDSRIRLALPTIREILDNGDSVILMSHLGRPKNRENEFSLRHIIPNLSKILNVPVKFADDCVGKETEQLARSLKPGEVLLLENLRFYEAEKNADCDFARKLAALADYFVNDAFGVAHRKHASTYKIAKFFGERKKLGYLMNREIQSLDKLLRSPDYPVVTILGGAKVSDKVALIKNLLNQSNDVIIGGAMAYTFIQAMGGQTGNSLVEEDCIEIAQEIIEKARQLGVKLHIPQDTVIANEFSNNADISVTDSMSIPEGWMGLDIGPESISHYRSVILKAKTILWNGPMGVYEFEKFRSGTEEVARAVADATGNGAFSMVGGGDSLAALEQTGLYKHVSYTSSGGGAMLKYLEGKSLPAIQAINEDDVNCPESVAQNEKGID